ncbi:MAG: GNAT family N-acetyltransferase [Octadecabacter sp.]
MVTDQNSHLAIELRRGPYVARFAGDAVDLQRCQQLRHHCFIDDAGGVPRADGLEQDAFDALCDHVLVEDPAGALVCCFRVMYLASGADLNMSYSAQYYDLEHLSGYRSAMVELGRFCVAPSVQDADVLRMAWGMLAAVVDARGVGMLFGCSSFVGTDATRYRAAFDLLAAGHLAPNVWAPKVADQPVVEYAQTAQPVTDRKAALEQVPALLKTYLTMGGWVSDHAVIDEDLKTLHVFTGLEISAIPAARAKALRAVPG